MRVLIVIVNSQGASDTQSREVMVYHIWVGSMRELW